LAAAAVARLNDQTSLAWDRGQGPQGRRDVPASRRLPLKLL
jgi:hypothetical protein